MWGATVVLQIPAPGEVTILSPCTCCRYNTPHTSHVCIWTTPDAVGSFFLQALVTLQLHLLDISSNFVHFLECWIRKSSIGPAVEISLYHISLEKEVNCDRLTPSPNNQNQSGLLKTKSVRCYVCYDFTTEKAHVLHWKC